MEKEQEQIYIITEQGDMGLGTKSITKEEQEKLNKTQKKDK